jgi:hypothetical protein
MVLDGNISGMVRRGYKTHKHSRNKCHKSVMVFGSKPSQTNQNQPTRRLRKRFKSEQNESKSNRSQLGRLGCDTHGMLPRKMAKSSTKILSSGVDGARKDSNACQHDGPSRFNPYRLGRVWHSVDFSASASFARIGSALQNWNRQSLSQQRMSRQSRARRGLLAVLLNRPKSFVRRKRSYRSERRQCAPA